MNLNQNYKKEQKSTRERESTHFFFFGGKYELNGRNDIEFIRNKLGEKKSQRIRKRK